ncbi:MAG: hypothetical protein WA151_04930, partial [Desulfatirhabdiaceae bacterium]
ILGSLKQSPAWICKRKKRLSVNGIAKPAFWSAVIESERDVLESILRRRRQAGRTIWPLVLYMRLFTGNSPCL